MQDDGGSAFPNPKSDLPGSYEAHPGMTLRDWFAGQALAGVMSAAETLAKSSPQASVIAEAVYCIADAMLAARKETPDAAR